MAGARNYILVPSQASKKFLPSAGRRGGDQGKVDEILGIVLLRR